jgi:UDP-2,3-diacylglucosamine hydrolase
VKGPEEISLPEGSLVLTDLHLFPGQDERASRLCTWLEQAPAFPRLLILGDLFDVWVGPAQARMPGAAAVLAALARRVAAGALIDIVPGNRDFLMDRDFERRSGARLHPAGMLAELPGGRRALFLHGDELCTRDLAYQRMKRVLRSRVTRAVARALPLACARWAAGRLRRATSRSLQAKPPEVKRMQPEAAASQARAQSADFIVCGHAHEYRDQPMDGGARWIVLDAWGGERDMLRIAAGGELEPACWSATGLARRIDGQPG